MAAIASVLLAHKSPVKVLVPTDAYHGVPTMFAKSFNDHGILHQAVDMTNSDKLRDVVAKEIGRSRGEHASLVVWMETPSNPLCQVSDIKEMCNAVEEMRGHAGEEFKITTIVDSTWAPPCITQPLKLGADAVIHSGTKYLGGHSDVLLGIVCTSPYTKEGKLLSERVKTIQTSIGAVASPFECWLTLRGLRTLHLRVERSSKSALELAQYLNAHKDVVKCHYPGLESHPQHKIATQQMGGFKSGKVNVLYGGMLSFEVRDEAMAMAVAGAVRIIHRATSLGGTESLIEHRASIEPVERRISPPGLLRLSVGLEDVDDLKQDLKRALEVAVKVCMK
jgi:cystathionine gamma-synthase